MQVDRLGIFVLVLAGLLVSGCIAKGGGQAQGGGEIIDIIEDSIINETGENASDDAVGTEPLVVEGQIGETLANNKLEMRVNWIDFTEVIGDTVIYPAESCWQEGTGLFAVVDLYVKNTGETVQEIELDKFGFYTVKPLSGEREPFSVYGMEDLIAETGHPFKLGELAPGEEVGGEIVFWINTRDREYYDVKGIGCTEPNDLSMERVVGISFTDSEYYITFDEDEPLVEDPGAGSFFIDLFDSEHIRTEGELGEWVTNENMAWEVKLNSIEYLLNRGGAGLHSAHSFIIDVEIRNTGKVTKMPIFFHADALVPRFLVVALSSVRLGKEEIIDVTDCMEIDETAKLDNPFYLTPMEPGESRRGEIYFDHAISVNKDYIGAETCYVYLKDPAFKGAAKIEVECPEEGWGDWGN